MIPGLDGIDHVHLYVPDKHKAAHWYATHLGFHVVDEMRVWDQGDEGPLTIEDGSGTIHLALFARKEYTPSTAIAFRCAGDEFLHWKRYLEAEGLLERCTDHDLSWSLYFSDPFGHYHEVTTYETATVVAALGDVCS